MNIFLCWIGLVLCFCRLAHLLNATHDYKWTVDAQGAVDISPEACSNAKFTQFEAMSKVVDSEALTASKSQMITSCGVGFSKWRQNLDLRCVLLAAPVGAGGPNQNTSRIQHEAVLRSPFIYRHSSASNLAPEWTSGPRLPSSASCDAHCIPNPCMQPSALRIHVFIYLWPTPRAGHAYATSCVYLLSISTLCNPFKNERKKNTREQ